MQVHRHDAVGAGDGDAVGEQPGADRLATFGLPVLTGVAVERANGGDALGRRPLGGVEHEQLLHDPLVDRLAVALEDEDVGAADALAEAAVELSVGERREHDLAQRDLEVLGDLLAELLVAPPREEHEVLLGHQLHRAGLLCRRRKLRLCGDGRQSRRRRAGAYAPAEEWSG